MYIFILLALFAIQLLALFRNDWVYRQRCIVMDCYGHLYYELLPSYSVMFWKCWIWDVNKFLSTGKTK